MQITGIMSVVSIIGAIFLYLGITLIFLVMIFTVLKHIQRNYRPSWTFLDYVSVGYMEHLYRKYIKRS